MAVPGRDDYGLIGIADPREVAEELVQQDFRATFTGPRGILPHRVRRYLAGQVEAGRWVVAWRLQEVCGMTADGQRQRWCESGRMSGVTGTRRAPSGRDGTGA